MGSVQSDVECPQCKNPHAMEDFYYKSDEIYVFCDNCGYHYERTIRRNDDGKFILKCPECEHIDTAERKGNIVVKLNDVSKKDKDKIKEYCKKNKIEFEEKNNTLYFIPKDFKFDHYKFLLLNLLKDLNVDFEDNDKKYCKKCNFVFDDFWKSIIYDEKEEKGKGSITIAGILFKCPHCKKESCPDFTDGKYYCRNKDCGKPFNKETVKNMFKRKKLSGVQSVSQIPQSMPDKEIKKWIEDLEKQENISIIRKQIWNGGNFDGETP